MEKSTDTAKKIRRKWIIQKCDETAYDLPLSKLNRPAEWDDIVLPQYNFAITQEIIRMPQSLIPYEKNIGQTVIIQISSFLQLTAKKIKK